MKRGQLTFTGVGDGGEGPGLVGLTGRSRQLVEPRGGLESLAFCRAFKTVTKIFSDISLWRPYSYS